MVATAVGLSVVAITIVPGADNYGQTRLENKPSWFMDELDARTERALDYLRRRMSYLVGGAVAEGRFAGIDNLPIPSSDARQIAAFRGRLAEDELDACYSRANAIVPERWVEIVDLANVLMVERTLEGSALHRALGLT